MALTRSTWQDPFENYLDVFEDRVNRLLEPFGPPSLFGARPLTQARPMPVDWAPSLDMVDTGKEVMLHCDLPGMTKDQIQISAQGRQLTISGETKHEEEKKEGQYRVRERRYGKFERRVALPQDVDLDQVQAKYENGVLKVKVPKKPEAHTERKAITIQ